MDKDKLAIALVKLMYAGAGCYFIYVLVSCSMPFVELAGK